MRYPEQSRECLLMRDISTCRNVVIALLRAKGPNAGLRRSDIMEASKIALRSEVPGATYQKVRGLATV
jgi:hypothetical protein